MIFFSRCDPLGPRALYSGLWVTSGDATSYNASQEGVRKSMALYRDDVKIPGTFRRRGMCSLLYQSDYNVHVSSMMFSSDRMVSYRGTPP